MQAAAHHAVVVNDESAVVQNGLGMENRQREFLRIIGIESDAGFDEGLEGDLAFHRDQGAEALAGDFKDRIGDFFDGFAFFKSRSEEGMAAEIGQRPAKFRLEDDDQGDGEKDRQAAQDPANDQQIEELREKVRVRKMSARPMRIRAPWVPRR